VSLEEKTAGAKKGRDHNEMLSLGNGGTLKLPEKKRCLDFSSVPAHNDECNCTEADQCNECTEAG
jgi:hypothetical protein